jgi:hypothetical protein
MTRWHIAGLLVAMLVLGVAESLDQSPSQGDGHELLRQCLTGLRALDAPQGDGSTMTDFGWCMGYILGFVEGYGFTVQYAFCLPGLGLPVEQLARVLVEWLRHHLALLPLPRTALMRAAFADTFPCTSAPNAGRAK